MTETNTIFEKDDQNKINEVQDNNEVTSENTGGNDKLLSPEIADITVNPNGSFTLEWNEITGADKYEVHASTDDEVYTLVDTVEDATAFTVINRVFGRTYYFKVRALKNDNDAAASDFGTAKSAVNNVKLLRPGITKITNNSDGSFTLKWEKITGADMFEVYTSTDGKSYSLVKAVEDATTLTVTNRVFGRTYYYKVKALKSDNEEIASDFGPAKSAVNKLKLLKPGITNITVNPNGSFTLKWERITGADKYEIYVSTNGETYTLYRTVAGSTMLTATSRVFGRTYYFRIRAVNNSNSIVTSEFGPAKSAVNNVKLLKPGITNVEVNPNGSFTIKYEKITGADRYDVYYSSDGEKSYKLYKSVPETTLTTYKLSGYSYYFKVRAVNSSNSEATSDFGPAKNIKK